MAGVVLKASVVLSLFVVAYHSVPRIRNFIASVLSLPVRRSVRFRVVIPSGFELGYNVEQGLILRLPERS
jgi:hypothetical protein